LQKIDFPTIHPHDNRSKTKASLNRRFSGFPVTFIITTIINLKIIKIMKKLLFILIAFVFLIPSNSSFGQTTVELGSGTLSNGTTGVPTPYGTYYKNHRQQYLILATELDALGVPAGALSALAFNVANVNTCSPMPNFTISMAHTNQSALTTTFEVTTYETVFTHPNFLPVTGWNTHNFCSPFTWDGTQNILVDICFDIIPGSFTQNASVLYTTTAFVSSLRYQADAVVACGTTNAGTTSSNRANMRITYGLFACPTPQAFTGSNITMTTVDLAWTSCGTETEWEIIYGAAGFDPQTTGTLVSSITTNPYTLTGLTQQTAYDVYVRADCGGTYSQWSGPLSFTTTAQPLSGNYTINSTQPTGGTNYNSFTDFATALNLGGLAGAITVDVVSGSGPYNEQFIVGQVNNSSAINTITINGNGETLEFLSTNTNLRGTFILNGTDYVTVDNLIIKALGELTSPAEYGWAVWLTNNADYNTFTNCEFYASTTSTSTNFAGFVTSSSATGATTSGAAASNLTVTNSKAIGGYYGIVINGPTSAPYSDNNTITNNEVTDFHLYGLYLRGQNNGLFSDNIISRPTRTSTGTLYMLYITQDMTGSSVMNNIITNFSPAVATTSSVYGIYGTTITATSGNELLIANNVIYGLGNVNGIQYGMYMLTTDNTRFYHNTISLDNVAQTGSSIIRGFYHSGNLATIDLTNNIISVTSNSTGTKHCLYFIQTTTNVPNLTSDNNVLHMGATSGTNHYVYWTGDGGTNYSTLAAWQGAGGNAYDQQSIDADPLFISPLLTPTNPFLDDIGADLLSIVPTDIFGAGRSGSPDPGAIEFEPPSCAVPTSLNVVTVTDNSVTVGWTPGDTEELWDVEIGLPGFTPGTGNEVTGVTSTPDNPWTATGLSQLTNYEFYVRADCEGTYSPWAGPVSFTTTLPPLSGNYTINSTQPTAGTNFNSFTDFATALNLGGVSGAVTVDVVTGTGPYNEQVMINAINNSSSTNTVTINGNGETLEYLSTTSAERATFKLNAANYLTVDNLIIKALGASTSSPTEYGWAVWLTSNADYNTFTNCEFHANTSTTSSNFNPFVTSNSSTSPITSGLAASNLTVTNCKAIGGYYGMTINGPTSAPFSENNLIMNNEISDFYMYGLYVRGQNNSQFTGNELHRTSRTNNSTLYTLYLTSNISNSVVSKNVLYNQGGTASSTSTVYGIYATSMTSPANEGVLIANNVIQGFENRNGLQYGIYLSTTGYANVYHNTVSMDNVAHTGSSAIYAFYHTGANANLDIQNNIFSYTTNSTGTKYNMYFATSTAIVNSNYNVLYRGATAGTNNTGYWTTPYNTLSDWQTANGGIYDQQSADDDPTFTTPLLTPQNGAVDNMGSDLMSIVPDDIFGVSRTDTPDPGAIEFAAATCLAPSDLNAANITAYTADMSWTGPVNASSWDIELGLTGFTPTGNPTATGVSNPHIYTGLNPSTTYDFYVRGDCGGGDYSSWVGPYSFTTDVTCPDPTNLSTVAVYPFSAEVQWTSIASVFDIEYGVAPYTFTGVANLTGVSNPATISGLIPETNYEYKVKAICGVGDESIWSTATGSFRTTCDYPTITSTTPGSRCETGTVDLSATASSGTINWYGSLTGGSVLGTGLNFTTPVISTTTSFYVAASSGFTSESAGKPTNTTTDNTTGSNWGLVFNVVNNDMSIQNVDVYSVGAGGDLTVTLQDNTGTPLQTFGPFTYPSGTTGSPVTVTVPLNFAVPVGTGYRLIMTSMGGNLIREFSSANTFPYTSASGNVVVTSGYISGTSTTYYWFYNWQVTTGCESPRTEVIATVNEEEYYLTVDEICDGDIYTWMGNDYTLAGSYFEYGQTAEGCLITYELQLTVNPTEYYLTTDEICDGDIYTWMGNDYTLAGTYFEYGQTAQGCLITYELQLTVNPTNFSSETVNVWDYELPYSWEGNLYWSGGTYTVTYPNILGCDSVKELILIANPSGTLWVNKLMGTAAQANWSAIAGIDRYQVRYWDTQGGGIFVTVVQTTNQFRKLTDLLPNTDYEIEIGYRTCASCPFIWGYYPNVAFNSGDVDFTFTQDIGTKMLAQWDALDDVTSYILQYRLSGGSWTMKGIFNTPEAVMGGINENSDYEFRVIPRYNNIGFWQSDIKTHTSNLVTYNVVYSGGETADFSWNWATALTPAASGYILQVREVGAALWTSYPTATNARFVGDLTTGLSYEYRLVVQFDGNTWGATSIQPLVGGGTKETVIEAMNMLNVYPNPVSDLLTVEILSEQTGTHIWNLYDVNGKLVMSGENQLTQGANYFEIETAHLSTGLYMLQSNVNGVLQTSRIIKQ
jgi:parallel beta-helix repeat protein